MQSSFTQYMKILCCTLSSESMKPGLLTHASSLLEAAKKQLLNFHTPIMHKSIAAACE